MNAKAHQLLLVTALGVAALAAAVRPAVGAADEFRGMWVSRFDGWTSSDMNVVMARIDEIMTKLATHHFNAVLFQIRGQADTLYPSPDEPWSPRVAPGWDSFDPAAYAIAAAHTRGLEFHAYINTHVCYGTGTPSDPSHLFYRHCNADDANARDWLIHDSSGTPVQYVENYVWIAPGVPDAQAYLRKQVMYVVSQYNVDGVHFDRIRTPNSGYSYDPISQARRYGEGNPNGLSFHDWTRDQITRFLRDMYAQIMEIKPGIKVSSAPFASGYLNVHQDPAAWLSSGSQDAVVPMIYGSADYFRSILPGWITMAHNAGRHVYGGHSIGSASIDDVIENVYTARSLGAEGNVVFSYSGINNGGYWYAFSGPGGPYEDPDVVPAMSWKADPPQGIIIGNVTHLNGAPVVDAHVTRTGSTYTALSSGDGLYSFLKVNPSTYTLAFSKPGLDPLQVPGVTVTAGQVTRVDVILDEGALVTISADRTVIRQSESVRFTPTVVLPTGIGIVSYTWRFGDQDVPGTGLPVEIDHTYNAVDTYLVRLDVVTSGSDTASSNEIEITVRPPPGDFDNDGDVDLEDFGHFQVCLSGATNPQNAPECQDAKLDGDADVDHDDFAIFQRCLTGADIPVDPGCAN